LQQDLLRRSHGAMGRRRRGGALTATKTDRKLAKKDGMASGGFKVFYCVADAALFVSHPGITNVW